MKLKILMILIAFLFINLASASQIQLNNTVFFSDISNSTIWVETITLDEVNITTEWTEFYNFNNDYVLFNNTNATYDAYIHLYNLTDTLIYTSNGSVVCSNITNCDGNINYTLQPNNHSYVLDNYNKTEGFVRTGDPLAFSASTSIYKNINSSLIDIINITVMVYTNGTVPDEPKYTSDTETFIKTYDSTEYIYSAVAGTLQLNISGIEQSASSGVLDLDSNPPLISYEAQTPVDYANLSQNSLYVNVTWTELNYANMTFLLWNDTNTVNSTVYTTPEYQINWTSLPNLNYTYQVNITDNSSNTNFTAIRHVTLDTTLPSISYIVPLNATYNSTTSLNMTVNVTENLGVKNATMYIYNSTNDEINQTTISFIQHTIHYILGTIYTFAYDGVFKWFYEAWDWANNLFTMPDNRTITIDTTIPLISIVYPTNTTYTANISEINYTFTELNPDSCWYSLDKGETNSSRVACGNNFTGLSYAEGTNNWTAWINDTAGNENSSSVVFEEKIISNCANLTTVGDTFVLSTSIINSALAICINITANNVTLDCSGYDINGDGSGTDGIYIQAGANNILIQNCNISGWPDGIDMRAHNITVKNSNFTNTNDIRCRTSNNTIINNYFVHTAVGSVWGIEGEAACTNANISYNTYEGGDCLIHSGLQASQVFHNIIKGSGNAGCLVYFSTNAGSHNYFLNNTIYATRYECVRLTNGAYNNTFDNLKCYDPHGSSGSGFDVYISSHTPNWNIIANSTINGSTGRGIDLRGSGTYSGWQIYNNFFNNTLNFRNLTTTGTNDYNVTKTVQTNIIEEHYFAGNYWGNTTGDGYSDTCTDENNDGICDAQYTLTPTDIDYLPLSSGNTSFPGVTLNSPETGNITNNATLIFNCSAEDVQGLLNISLYHNVSGSWTLNQTNNVNGTANTTTFTVLDTPDGNYKWNCLAYNSRNYSDWYSSNWTFTIDTTNPLISITNPTNTTYSTNQTDINYTFTELNPDSCWYSTDKGETNSTRVSCGTNWTGLISTEGYNNWTMWMNDSANNYNSSSISFWKDTNLSGITLLGPSNLSEDSDGIVDFSFNVTDISNVTNCSLYTNDIWQYTKVGIIVNISQTITEVNPIETDQLRWYISCRDEFSNEGNSTLYYVDTKVGGGSASGGGGGSGGGSIGGSLGISNISSRVCELTHSSADRETGEYTEIYDIIEMLEIETGKTYDFTTIRTYIDNWQPLCSDLINRTLKEDFVCEKLYYFIIQYNWNYTYSDIYNLKDTLKKDISVSIGILEHYLDEYDDFCYLTGYSDKLPPKPSPIIKILPIFNLTNCSVSLENSFFDVNLPPNKWFGKMYVGNLSCSKVNFWRFFVGLEKEENDRYYLVGIRLYIILVIAIIILAVILIKRDKKTKKAIDRLSQEES